MRQTKHTVVQMVAAVKQMEAARAAAVGARAGQGARNTGGRQT